MAMGIPVITNSGVGDVEKIVNKYNSGIIVKDFSDKSFSEVANIVASGKSFDKAAIRKGAVEFYALPEAIERYRKVYKTILG